MSDHPPLTLNDHRQIPQVGFGTYKLKGGSCTDAVRMALETGYRLVDTASIYENEQEVGRGLGDRSDIFVQTKIWNDDQGHEQTIKAAHASLDRLGRDHVDMLLIHWPCPEQGKFVDTWKAMIDLREEGKAKSIGVSNFRPDDLKRVVDATGVVPALNQIELHPSFQQDELRALHDEMGILTQCWSPLGQGEGLAQTAVQSIAEEIGEDASAVIIAWHLQHGLLPIPKASSRAHIDANLRGLSVTLSNRQIAAIDALDSDDGRMGPDPSALN